MSTRTAEARGAREARGQSRRRGGTGRLRVRAGGGETPGGSGSGREEGRPWEARGQGGRRRDPTPLGHWGRSGSGQEDKRPHTLGAVRRLGVRLGGGETAGDLGSGREEGRPREARGHGRRRDPTPLGQ